MILTNLLAFVGAYTIGTWTWRIFVKLCEWNHWPFLCWLRRGNHGPIQVLAWREKAFKCRCETCGRMFLGGSNPGAPMDLIPWTEEMEKEFAGGGVDGDTLGKEHNQG